MDTERTKKQSKRLSWLLRHGANEAGVSMDPAGWVAVADVLRAMGLSRADLEVVVRENDKRRLELDGDRVRACQGHSTAGTPVTAEALEASWTERASDEPLWHGTASAALAGIARDGILPVTRTHVHLAEELTSKVGKRANVDVMLKVDALRLRACGVSVFAAPNGVLLARQVPREAIVDLRAMTRRARGEEAALRALMGL